MHRCPHLLWQVLVSKCVRIYVSDAAYLILSFFSSLDFFYAVAYDIGRNHIRGTGDWNQLRGSVEGRGRDLKVGEIFKHNKPCTEVGFWKIWSVVYATKRSRLNTHALLLSSPCIIELIFQLSWVAYAPSIIKIVCDIRTSFSYDL